MTNCPLRCTFCEVCLCEISCTCKNFAIGFTFCVHSHLSILNSNKYLKDENNLDDTNDSDCTIEEDKKVLNLEPNFENDFSLDDLINIEEKEDDQKLLNQLKDLNQEVGQLITNPNLKLDKLKFNSARLHLNNLKTILNTNISCNLIDFIKSPSKKIKMNKQNRKF